MVVRQSRRRINSELFFPDEILNEILSRLAAKDVLGYRCVCKRWRDFTSTTDFTHLYTQRHGIPMILKNDSNRLHLFDRCWEPARKRPDIRKVYNPNAANKGLSVTSQGVVSHNGLIVTYGFKKGVDLCMRCAVIYNPVYRDVVRITPPPFNRSRSEIYGVFFHPLHKEHCTLWRISDTVSLQAQYKILNLESNPKWRDIRNPCHLNAKLMDPVLIDKYLYWTVEPYQHYKPQYYLDDKLSFNCDIMEYDIANEEFRVIPCPVPVTRCCRSYNASLIDNGGVLSLVQVFPSKEMVKITIWTMKGQAEQLWTSCDYIISSDVYPRGYGVLPRAIAFRNGELVLQSDGRLYLCNLKLGTYRKFGQERNRGVSFSSHGQERNHGVSFSSHAVSLVSLRNWKSNICMVEKEANNQTEDRGSITQIT